MPGIVVVQLKPNAVFSSDGLYVPVWLSYSDGQQSAPLHQGNVSFGPGRPLPF